MRTATRAAVAGALWLTVTAATGCDKANAGRDADAPATTANGDLDLRKHPTILFEVFGERDDPRMVPVGVLEGGKLHAIHLSPAGWQAFDRLYHHPGASYTLYQDGHAVGSATVKQGMWSKPDAPIYALPNCQNLLPLASVRLDGSVKAGITVEFLATTATLGAPPSGAPLAPSAATSLARDVAAKVAEDARIPRARLDSLDFHAVAVNTGATTNPTLVVSYIDPNAEEAAAHGDETSALFAIADKTGGAYAPSFTKVINGPAAHAEYRRYVDHVDLNGDGVDEIVLEGWQYGGDTYLMVMRFKDGHWNEVFRGAPNWCMDPRG
jgi:hypothetical protein